MVELYCFFDNWIFQVAFLCQRNIHLFLLFSIGFCIIASVYPWLCLLIFITNFLFSFPRPRIKQQQKKPFAPFQKVDILVRQLSALQTQLDTKKRDFYEYVAKELQELQDCGKLDEVVMLGSCKFSVGCLFFVSILFS